jgi:hypothetical protein
MDARMRKTVLALAPLLIVASFGACSRDPGGGPKIKPLPKTGFRVEWVGRPNIPATIPAGHIFPVTVTVKNTGDQVWLDPDSSDATPYAAGSVRLGYRWLRPSEVKAPNMGYAEARGDLLKPLSPDDSASLTVQVTAPPEPGDYKLQLDLCQELVSWFEPKGAAPLLVLVKVE